MSPQQKYFYSIFRYKPFKDSRKTYVWNSQTRKDLKDYNLEDLSI